MTSKERFLAAIRNEIPDRVPVTPDFSCYIPCRRTGLPFWEILFEGRVSLADAYLDTARHFGIDPWTGGHFAAPLTHDDLQYQEKSSMAYDAHRDAMVRRTEYLTPDGSLTKTELCYRNEPPATIEKQIKNLESDWKKHRWLSPFPSGVDMSALESMRSACERDACAFGLGMSYPGFHVWHVFVEGGLAPLVFAEADASRTLDAWLEWDMARGTRIMELTLACKPDYVLFGGSGTITMASPALAMKYAIPALRKWSAMAKSAGIPTLLHSCGKSRILVDMLVDHTDVNCINPLEHAPMGDIDLAELKKARGKDIALMGNLHTTATMLLGSPEEVREASAYAMQDAGYKGGFILSTGDQCGRDTPDANLHAMVEAAHELGVYDPATGRLPKLELWASGRSRR